MVHSKKDLWLLVPLLWGVYMPPTGQRGQGKVWNRWGLQSSPSRASDATAWQAGRGK